LELEHANALWTGDSLLRLVEVARHYSGSTIAVPRNLRPQVAFSSRKSHIPQGYNGHVNCGTALAYVAAQLGTNTAKGRGEPGG
jgi:hypothetical protein